jgi:hypothetical protein
VKAGDLVKEVGFVNIKINFLSTSSEFFKGNFSYFFVLSGA